MKIFNWGILGPGKIAQKFAQDLAFVPNAKLYAVGSRNLERAQNFAKEHKAITYFDSYEALVNCAEVDIIYIATPHSEHFKNTLLCINARKPVLCEKAFAINSAQLAQMVALAKSKKVFLQEAIWTRFHPAIIHVLTIIQSGQIGKIVHIQADFGFKANPDPEGRLFNPNLTGGSLMDIGIYPIFISKLILGQPTVIKAIGTLASTGVDQNCSITMQFENGATASLFSTLMANTPTVCSIYGSLGKIEIQSRFHETKGFTLTLDGQESQFFETERLGHGYSYEAADAQRCLQENKLENNLLPLLFSQELMQILDEVRMQMGLQYPQEK